MSRASKLIESVNKIMKINEELPPELAKLFREHRYSARYIREILTDKLGIDIQNTNFDKMELTNGRDPRFGNKDNLFIISGPDGIALMQGREEVKRSHGDKPTTLLYDSEHRITTRSPRKDMIENGIKFFHLGDIQSLSDTRAQRAASREGMVDRNPKMAGRNGYDKSGYKLNPDKYVDMLAELKLKQNDRKVFDDAIDYIKEMQVTALDLLSTSSSETSSRNRAIAKAIMGELTNLMRDLDNCIRTVTVYSNRATSDPESAKFQDEMIKEYIMNFTSDFIKLKERVTKTLDGRRKVF